jgi:hypothetical protein
MSVPLWISETVEQFWQAADGDPQTFPRDLRVPIARALPLTIVLLPRLRVAAIDAWLREYAGWWSTGIHDRALRACLIACYGQGVVFLDGSDPEDEQRFSLAHELAHFLRDYWRVREVVRRRLGEEVLEVLDGQRPPSQIERAHALLAGMQIGVHVHLMDRAEDGQPVTTVIDEAEENADRLALELLAPVATVLERAKELNDEDRLNKLTSLLHEAFGLPVEFALQYASALVRPSYQPDSLMRRLGLRG